MAAGDRIFMAKESTSQEILSNTKKIIEDAKAKPKRYGMRINLLDSNPATRVKYLYDAVGMTPAGMNFSAPPRPPRRSRQPWSSSIAWRRSNSARGAAA